MPRGHNALPDNAATPLQYAERIAVYLRDPSTIRIRTLEYFGRAPSMARCQRIVDDLARREAAQRRKAERRATEMKFVNVTDPTFKACGHPRTDENIAIVGDRMICRTCKTASYEDWKTSQARLRAAMQLEPIATQAVIISPARRVLARAADLTGLTVDDLRSRSRFRKVARARQAIAYVLHTRGAKFEWSHSRIAAFLCRDDHTTIMYACNQAKALVEHDEDFAGFVAALNKAWDAAPPKVPAEIVAQFLREEAA